jgi:hypothetical protein
MSQDVGSYPPRFTSAQVVTPEQDGGLNRGLAEKARRVSRKLMLEYRAKDEM